jgi:hypothetical protein
VVLFLKKKNQKDFCYFGPRWFHIRGLNEWKSFCRTGGPVLFLQKRSSYFVVAKWNAGQRRLFTSVNQTACCNAQKRSDGLGFF